MFILQGVRFHHNILTAHSAFRHRRDFRAHFKLQKPTLTVAAISAPFFRNVHSTSFHLTLRGHKFTLTLCTVLKLMSNSSSVIVLSVCVNNPNRNCATLLSERDTICTQYNHVPANHTLRSSNTSFFSVFLHKRDSVCDRF